MSKFRIILFLIVLLAQSTRLVAQSSELSKTLLENNKIIKTMLDYRYKGGSGAFERDFFFYVDYNQISRQSCTVGTTIMVFDVH